jgi:pimeloyl-ACP methyl ester carboxylesterase
MKLPAFRNRRGELLDTSLHTATQERCLLLLGHGVTGNKDRPLLVALGEGLAARGWPCLRISFAGNGQSEGRFEDSNISKNAEDLEDLLAALPAELALAYCGHSMGGAVGTLVASRSPRLRALISLAGMFHTKEFYQREFGAQPAGASCMWEDASCPLSQSFAHDLLSRENLSSSVRALRIPFLLLHGTADDLVLLKDSEDAFTLAPEPKRLVRIAGAGHSFDEGSYLRIVEEIDAWLQVCCD